MDRKSFAERMHAALNDIEARIQEVSHRLQHADAQDETDRSVEQQIRDRSAALHRKAEEVVASSDSDWDEFVREMEEDFGALNTLFKDWETSVDRRFSRSD